MKDDRVGQRFVGLVARATPRRTATNAAPAPSPRRFRTDTRACVWSVRPGYACDLSQGQVAGSPLAHVRSSRRAVRRESVALAGVARAQASRRDDALRARSGSAPVPAAEALQQAARLISGPDARVLAMLCARRNRCRKRRR